MTAENEGPGPWYYCLKHQRVEEEGQQDRARYLLGPFDTPEEAARALETARENSEAWDEQDALDDGPAGR